MFFFSLFRSSCCCCTYYYYYYYYYYSFISCVIIAIYYRIYVDDGVVIYMAQVIHANIHYESFMAFNNKEARYTYTTHTLVYFKEMQWTFSQLNYIFFLWIVHFHTAVAALCRMHTAVFCTIAL